MEGEEEDDDDVIVLPQEEPVITEIPDDDDHEPHNKLETSENNEAAEVPSSSSANVISQDTGISADQNSEEIADEDGEDNDANPNNESDVQILEPQISIMNLDEYEETNVTSTTLDDSVPVVKIKQEPKYEGYEDDEDDGFEDVGTFEAVPVNVLDDETSGTRSLQFSIYA